MLFGYTLYAALIWFVIVMSIIFVQSEKILAIKPWQSGRVKRALVSGVLLGISIWFIPAIEIVVKTSVAPVSFVPLVAAKQAVGQLSGWFFAEKIRPHDIFSGNIFFNHTPMSAFVDNIFSGWRWHVIAFMAIIFLLTTVGVYISVRAKPLRAWRVIMLLLTAIFGGYIIGWYGLDGDRLFTRRLDGVLAIMLLIFALLGVEYLATRLTRIRPLWFRPILIVSAIVFVSWFAATAYTSGPDLRVVSYDEYQAAEYVAKQSIPPLVGAGEEGVSFNKRCVLADTWLLLALEAVGGRRIVGGRFPIDYQFGQTQRVWLYESLIKDPSEVIINSARKVTGANECFVAMPINLLTEAAMEEVKKLAPNEAQLFGNIYVGRSDVMMKQKTETVDIEKK